ncbi:hypothetical protein BOO86_02595 [Mycobacterium sp. CBMA 234]|uniref:hypothetical protein n=1 Tax=Mycolicibacterium sp. CBMA 234 TaxID=1918495 RepID=UPI0012DEE4E3|nr:hypothetical protein [Mycolicibacterium sp. CBMA 234]MUL63343.1 hypothetical protein [Mycolicibacterium sp. CBMA 234]
MGAFDWLTGTAGPDPDTVPVGQLELRDRLLRLNNPAIAWQVRDGSPEGVDLIAEWKGDDPDWRRLFDGVDLNLTFKVHMRFDPDKAELRVQDHMIEWKYSTDFDSPNRPIERRERGNLSVETTGRVNGTKYTFKTAEMKNAIKHTVTSSGWTHRAVMMRKV